MALTNHKEQLRFVVEASPSPVLEDPFAVLFVGLGKKCLENWAEASCGFDWLGPMVVFA